MRHLLPGIWFVLATAAGTLLGGALGLESLRQERGHSAPTRPAAPARPLDAPPSDPPAPDRPALTLALAGDVLLSGPVEQLTAAHGVHYPFAHVGDLLRNADLAFCNLECPLTSVHSPTPLKVRHGALLPNEFLFRAEPAAVRSLEWAGIDVVSLANNHAMDHGIEGLRETLATLAGYGIRHCGAGTDLAAASSATLTESRGARVAFLAYCWDGTLPGTTHFAADATRPGVAFVRGAAARQPAAETLGRLQREVQRAGLEADFTVVSFHWGRELSSRPEAAQTKLARFAIDCGADLVVGHHPHCLQGIEVYRGRPILYSLGNLVFRSNAWLTRQTAVARVTVRQGAVCDLVLHPLVIHGSQPRPPTPAERARICGRIRSLSRERGTVLAAAVSGGELVCHLPLAPPEATDLPGALLAAEREGSRSGSATLSPHDPVTAQESPAT